MQITIPFMPRFKDPMISGIKILTTRTKRYGKAGDWFNAFGQTFVLIRVEQHPLGYSAGHWKEEGCSSYDDFISVWKSIHPHRELDTGHMFWVHEFQNISKKSLEAPQ